MTLTLQASPEFRAYERARDAVRAIKHGLSSAGVSTDASAYWAEELENIDYMIDASPLIVRKLRHHAFHITGIRPYDYRAKGDTRRETFEARLRALRALDTDGLLVPEAPAFGGFGYRIDDRLFNIDTLKFYEVLIGMGRGGVLAPLRGKAGRPTVCEIGGGWGGFAYQFKTLFPPTRYVIVDFPELFLFSATYLGALFPDASLAFCGTAETPTLRDTRDADIVFVPSSMAAELTSERLDVAVNMVSFQEMTDRQVRGYASIAAAAGCPWLYSLNRERSPYNTELVRVSDALATRYRLTEVAVLESDYTTAMKKPPKASPPAARSEFNYRHLVGRLDPASAIVGRTGTRADIGAVSTNTANAGRARVVLGMTLYNKGGYLPEAIESLLSQSYRDFRLVLLDDASSDDTERVCREIVARDPRVTYFRHDSRRGMIATWREVVALAQRDCPDAQYFAWVSDHDRWHDRWLDSMVAALDADPEVVLAYPITRRITTDGAELDKGPRMFDTAGRQGIPARWTHMCHEGIGAGDMVYGLMRIDALSRAGTFRPVLRPDRLLIAELTLYGRFAQIPEVLWFRREFEGTSVQRQRHSLILAGEEPKWFGAPPWFQHAATLWREYVQAVPPPLPISRAQWVRMLLRYQLTYGWRHFRKTEASHAIGRGIDHAVWAKKLTKHYWHHAVYNVLVGARVAWARARRLGRRALYEALMLTHRLGLRGRGKAETR